MLVLALPAALLSREKIGLRSLVDPYDSRSTWESDFSRVILVAERESCTVLPALHYVLGSRYIYGFR